MQVFVLVFRSEGTVLIAQSNGLGKRITHLVFGPEGNIHWVILKRMNRSFRTENRVVVRFSQPCGPCGLGCKNRSFRTEYQNQYAELKNRVLKIVPRDSRPWLALSFKCSLSCLREGDVQTA
jgi:hypothetical protein